LIRCEGRKELTVLFYEGIHKKMTTEILASNFGRGLFLVVFAPFIVLAAFPLPFYLARFLFKNEVTKKYIGRFVEVFPMAGCLGMGFMVIAVPASGMAALWLVFQLDRELFR